MPSYGQMDLSARPCHPQTMDVVIEFFQKVFQDFLYFGLSRVFFGKDFDQKEIKGWRKALVTVTAFLISVGLVFGLFYLLLLR